MGKTIICDELVEYVADKLSTGMKMYALKAELERDFACQISDGVLNDLREKALELLKNQATMSADAHRSFAVNTLYGVLQSNDSKPSDKIQVARLLQEVFAPRRSFADERSEHIRQILREIDESIEETPPQVSATVADAANEGPAALPSDPTGSTGDIGG